MRTLFHSQLLLHHCRVRYATQVCRDPREREASPGLQDPQDLKGFQGFQVPLDLQDNRVNLERVDFLVTADAYFGNISIIEQDKLVICIANPDAHTHTHCIQSNIRMHFFFYCARYLEANVYCYIVSCCLN